MTKKSKVTKKQVIAAAAIAAMMTMSMPVMASDNVMAGVLPGGCYNNTNEETSDIYNDYKNNKIGTESDGNGSAYFRIPDVVNDDTDEDTEESYVVTFPGGYTESEEEPAEEETGNAEITGTWYGVLGSSPVSLTIGSDYTFCLNFLDSDEVISGSYTTNNDMITLDFNNGATCTFQVSSDAKTMFSVGAVTGTLAKTAENYDADDTADSDYAAYDDGVNANSFDGTWSAVNAEVSYGLEIDRDYGFSFQSGAKQYSLGDLDDINDMKVYVENGKVSVYIQKYDGSSVSFENMSTSFEDDKLTFKNSGNMTNVHGYIQECPSGNGAADLVFETDSNTITFHMSQV